MSRLVCDFCCSTDSGDEIVWDYPAKSFTMHIKSPAPAEYTSHGHWGACAACHKLIDDGERDKLVKRSVEKFFSNKGINISLVPPEMIAVLKQSIKELHDNFFTHRCGICKLVK